MYAGENTDLPTTLRRCPSTDHRHDETAAPLPAQPPPTEITRMASELDRRRCGGPLTADGTDRLATNDWFSSALSKLPEVEDDRSLSQVLDDMGIQTVEDLRAFRRLVAVEAAAQALAWASATTRHGRAVTADSVLREVDNATL